MVYNLCMNECYRHTWPLNGAGQQCCYDILGYLITIGNGAGTPDRRAAAEGENPDGSCNWSTIGVWSHFWCDVVPYYWYDDDIYLDEHPPSRPPGYPDNSGVFSVIESAVTRT